MLSRFLSPRGIQLFGFRRLTIGLSAVVALFTAVPGSFSHATPIALMAGFMLTYAASRASFFMAANTLFYCDVHGAEIGHATVLSAVAQQLSLGLGFSLAAQILEAMGGVSAPGAFTWTFAAVAILPLLGTLAVFGLPAGGGRHDAPPRARLTAQPAGTNSCRAPNIAAVLSANPPVASSGGARGMPTRCMCARALSGSSTSQTSANTPDAGWRR